MPSAMTDDLWPALPLAAWQHTYATLHMWTQVVGKTCLAVAPPQNHWWHVALHVTSRGLMTSPLPADRLTFEVAFDFVDHDLTVRTSRGATRRIPLRGVVNCPDYVMQEAYSQECASCGYWPGGGIVAVPAFYAYAYPAPPGYDEVAVSGLRSSAASFGSSFCRTKRCARQNGPMKLSWG